MEILSSATPKQQVQVALLTFDNAIQTYVREIDKLVSREDDQAIIQLEQLRSAFTNKLTELRSLIQVIDRFELGYITHKITTEDSLDK